MIAKGGNIIYFPNGINDNGSMQYYFQVSDSRSNSLIRLTDGFVYNYDWRSLSFSSESGVTSSPTIVTQHCGVTEINDDEHNLSGLLLQLKKDFPDVMLKSIALPVSSSQSGIGYAIVSDSAIKHGLLPSQTFGAISNNNLELLFEAICEIHNETIDIERDAASVRLQLDESIKAMSPAPALSKAKRMTM